jgi:hypothetical protein
MNDDEIIPVTELLKQLKRQEMLTKNSASEELFKIHTMRIRLATSFRIIETP